MRLLLVLTSLFITSCFSLGIPEIYQRETTPHKLEVGDVVGVHADFEKIYRHGLAEEDRRNIGMQFVFGVIPFTNLYLQHTSLAQITEKLLEENHRVALVSSDLVESLPLVIRIENVDISINVYDFLFFRRLSIDGEITGFVNRNSKGVVKEPFEQEILSSSYLKAAHLPKLSLELDKAITEALAEMTSKILPFHDYREGRRFMDLSFDSSSVVFLSPPVLSATTEEKTGLRRLVGSSYGPGSEVLYENLSLGRVFQRGLEVSFAEKGLSFVSSGSRIGLPLHLETEFQLIELQENSVKLIALLSLYNSEELLKTQKFEEEVQLIESSDALWFATLENAGKMVADKFLVDGTSK